MAKSGVEDNNGYNLEQEHELQICNGNYKNEPKLYEIGANENKPVNDVTNEINSSKKKEKMEQIIRILTTISIHVIVIAYFSYATYHYRDVNLYKCFWDTDNKLCGIQFCNGYGMLILLVSFTYVGLFYYYVLKPNVGRYLHCKYLSPAMQRWSKLCRTSIGSTIVMALLLLALVIFLYFETKDEPQKLVSLTAPCCFILLGYIFSTNRSAIKWRTVITGLTSQFLLGIICIRWKVGREIFQCIGTKMAIFLSYTDVGSRFVYGDEIVDKGIFAFTILSTIFFFSFFISILYYFGTMQWVILKFGWIIQELLGTTVCESIMAAANIFIGMSESPLLIRPYIEKLTASEIHSIMASGFATVSGSVLAAYMAYGASAAHLITSSVMAAPATLAISKLYMPETEESNTSSETIQLEKSTETSFLDAASTGAANAIPLILGTIANLVAFVAFIAFMNGLVNWLGFLVGLEDIDFEWILAKLFIPIAWTMGVPSDDCNLVAKVVATKTIINEFIAYQRLGKYIETHAISARSAGITTFAICGFANPSSLGILIGVLTSIAPSRRSTITAVAFRAFIVGCIVCFVSASFAGLLIHEDEQQNAYNKFLSQLQHKNTTVEIVL